MKFVNPNMFWGILAILIPIIIHLWNKKKSIVLPWAATQFLNEKTLQQSRGIHLENLFLLFVRILLLLVLMTALAQPLFKTQNSLKTHWVLPDPNVVQNFKFEISQALKNGEKVFWLNGKELKDLKEIPEKVELQNGINEIEETLKGNEFAEIYVNNSPNLSVFSKVYVPVDFKLHIHKDDLPSSQKGFITLSNGRFLGLNQSGELAEVKAEGERLHNGKFYVLNQTSETGIEPSLKAISDVYGLEFEMHKERKSDILYDLVFTNDLSSFQSKDRLVFVSDAKEIQNKTYKNNIFYFDEKLNLESSDEVINGLLPEFVLEQLMTSLGLQNTSSSISEKQVLSNFVKRSEQKQNASINTALIFVFLIVLILERWLALKSNK